MSDNLAPDANAAEWRIRLAEFWAEGIPLSGSMGVEIRSLDEHRLEVAAPLAPNRNHMGTAFGGSLLSLATLAGWGVALITAGFPGAQDIVIRDGRMRFLVPVDDELVATAERPPPAEAIAFREHLAARGWARLKVSVAIRGPDGKAAAQFEGEFVAVNRERARNRR